MTLFPRLKVKARLANAKALRTKGFWRNWKRNLDYFSKQVVNLQGTPEQISRGLAAGVFAGVFPLFGFQIIIGVFLASLFRGNKLIAAAGTWLSNPLTYVPIFAFNFQVGQWLVGSKNDWSVVVDGVENWQELIQLGTEFATTLFLGCLVVGLVCAVSSYYLCLRLVRRFRQQSQNKLFSISMNSRRY